MGTMLPQKDTSMSNNDSPIFVGAPFSAPHPCDAVLVSCTECPHGAWFRGEEGATGEQLTICFDCYFNTPDGETMLSEEAFEQLEEMGVSRHEAYTLLADLEEERLNEGN